MSARATPRYAPEDPTLPKPWRGLVDGTTGYLYYWNPDTNKTQYERPLPPEDQFQRPPPPSQPARRGISSAAVAAPDRRRRRSYSPDEANDRYAPRARTFNQGGGGGSRGGGMDVHDANDARDPRAMSIGGRRDHPAGAGVGSAEAYRQRHEIIVLGDNVPAPLTTFESTDFPLEILKEFGKAGFQYPTPIQAQSWPIALEGIDIVAVAKTGSGKTLGYLLPGFIRIKQLHNDPRVGPTVLVLAPTRELATQIEAEVSKFGRAAHISCTCLYGGAPKGPQLKALERGVDIVVATPGRLWDIKEMRRLSLRQVSYLVLDEADRMLDMGFEPEIRRIIKEVPQHHQTLMFTATWPKEVRAIAKDLLVHPVQVNIGRVDELVANNAITQNVEVIMQPEKLRRVEQILRLQERGAKVLIFCITKRMCDQLAQSLMRQFPVAVIHGDKSQVERERVLSYFRSGRTPILIATDIAARGLDIKDIRTVINYDFPTGIEDYVHRIGRTGRAGATGVAYTFFCHKDARFAKDLIKILEVAKQRVPRELRALALQGGGGGGGRRPSQLMRGWRPVDNPTDRAAGGRDLERDADQLSGRSRRPEPDFGRYDGDRGPRRGYDAPAPYASNGRYDEVVGDDRGPKVGVKDQRNSSYNGYRSPSPKMARSDYPSRTLHSPRHAHTDYHSHDLRSPSPKRKPNDYPPFNNHSHRRARSDYPSRDIRSPSPKRKPNDYRPLNNHSPRRARSDYSSRDMRSPSPSPKREPIDYPPFNNHGPTPQQFNTEYRSRNYYSSSPRRDHSDFPSHSPRKLCASYEGANSRSPSPNPKRSRDHSASDSRSSSRSGSPKMTRKYSTRDTASPNTQKWRDNVRSHSQSPSPTNSPHRRRSRSASADRDQDRHHPVDRVNSRLVSDVRRISATSPASPPNVSHEKDGSPYGDSGPIKEEVNNTYSDQRREHSDSTIRESDGGYAGANGLHSPPQKGLNDGMEWDEDTLADVV